MVNVVMEEEVSDLDEVTVVAYGERKKRELISSVSPVFVMRYPNRGRPNR